jgi:hypothetical protein
MGRIVTAAKSVSSNRPGSKLSIVSLLSGIAPRSSLARRLALWDLQNDSRAHYDNPNEITENEITVNPAAPFGVHRLAP